MSDQGWIKLHRSIMGSDTFSKLTATQKLIAIYIILNANHEDGVWYDKYKDIEVNVKRGQLVTSRNKIANTWFSGDKEITEQKIRTCLKKLERLQFLTIKPTKHYTLLEVLNYSVYQQKDIEDNQQPNQATTKQQPSNNQAITTNKNDKNDKKVLKDIYADHVLLTKDEHKKLVEKLGEQKALEMIERLNMYGHTNGKAFKGYTSHYHVILNWFNRDNKGGQANGHGGRNNSYSKPSKAGYRPSEVDWENEPDTLC